MNVAVPLALLASLVAGCDGRPKLRAAPSDGGAAVAQGAPHAAASDSDESGHGEAHPPSPGPPVATATALAPQARAELTTLRVMAHVGAVIIRKEEGGWVVSGPNGCQVSPARLERALDNLASLRSVPTPERPQDGAEFELQVVAQVGQARVLHFDMAGRVAGRDLVQLGDYSTHWITGFDRELWAPNAKAWCGPS
ncbi:MAG: hypothetical protein K0R38_1451 [Polyangiaceae bacterium]|nr:hypothetical protein [Polyangiaceae bacterium]